MQLRVRHLTTFRYARPIAGAIQALRLTPRPYDGLTVLRWQVRGDRNRPLPTYIDGLGNVVHSNSINRPHESATIRVEGEVETRATGGLVRGAPEPLPPTYFLRVTALTVPEAAIAAFAADAARGATLALRLAALMERVREHVALLDGLGDAATTAAEALQARSGVCQDHAHLFIAACRSLGVPARCVGGYLWTGDDEGERSASHAWAEAYVADTGWIGFDPAKAMQPTDAYIRVAVGLDYAAAAPIRGIRRGDAAETLSVTVKVGAVEGSQ